MISNSANGTATDSNGQFTLSGVTDNDELQISFLGYKTVTMQIARAPPSRQRSKKIRVIWMKS